MNHCHVTHNMDLTQTLSHVMYEDIDLNDRGYRGFITLYHLNNNIHQISDVLNTLAENTFKI